MTQLFLTPIDLNNNELRNVLVQSVAGDPTGVEAKIIYNSTGHVLKYHNGTAWIDVLARANHTGSQLAATISDFDTQVRTSRLDQMAQPTGSMNYNSQLLTNIANPVSAQDAATKSYADALSTGLDFKASVRAATVGAITLSAPQTVDGVAVIAGDRVLVKNQAAGATNGIYTVAAGAWVRATDFDSSAEVTGGAYTFVNEGTVNADSGWVLGTNDPITLATTALVFVQFSGAGQLTAGNGIAITGNAVATNVDAAQFQYVSGVLTLQTLYQTRKVTANVGDGAAVAIVVTHNLNTRDIDVTLLQSATPWAKVFCDVEATSVNTVTLRFTTAPTSNQYRVMILG